MSNDFVPMDGDVESQKLGESLVITETEECGQIVRVVLRRIDGREFALAKDIPVYAAGYVGKFGNASWGYM